MDVGSWALAQIPGAIEGDSQTRTIKASKDTLLLPLVAVK